MLWHLKERRKSPYKRHEQPRLLHNNPCAHPLSSYCIVGDPTVWLWWPYSDPHCALIRMLSDGVCFEHAQRACHCSVFFAIPQHLLTMPLCCCCDACDYTARTSVFCIFLGCHGIAVRTLLWCDRGFTLLRRRGFVKGFYNKKVFRPSWLTYQNHVYKNYQSPIRFDVKILLKSAQGLKTNI